MMDVGSKTVGELGERFVVREIIRHLDIAPNLIDGYGHDAGFVDLTVHDDELLVVNTDRSGINIAYKLGLAGSECVGDLAVSHAVSDILAAGGTPKVVSIALLLPSETKIDFAIGLMAGAQAAACRYGATIACGDTKQNPKVTIVVTAIGVVKRAHRLTRSNAHSGDLLTVTGHLGAMLLGIITHRRKLKVDDNIRLILNDALVQQYPPFQLARALSDAKIANACMDISDGLSGTVHAMCSASGVGALVNENSIPIDPRLTALGNQLGLRRVQLALAGGDVAISLRDSTE